MAMIARKFRKFYKKSSERREFKNFKNQKEKKETIICFECKKLGHTKSECPLLNQAKKKVMVATWDDSDDETSDEEELHEVSSLALKAIGEELDEVNDLPSYDELFEAFIELHNDLKKIGMKNVSLKKKILEISNKNDVLQKKKMIL